MFKNDMLSPKEIAAMKLAKRKKAIISKRNQMSETLNADQITLQQAQTPIAEENKHSQFMTVVE